MHIYSICINSQDHWEAFYLYDFICIWDARMWHFRVKTKVWDLWVGPALHYMEIQWQAESAQSQMYMNNDWCIKLLEPVLDLKTTVFIFLLINWSILSGRSSLNKPLMKGPQESVHWEPEKWRQWRQWSREPGSVMWDKDQPQTQETQGMQIYLLTQKMVPGLWVLSLSNWGEPALLLLTCLICSVDFGNEWMNEKAELGHPDWLLNS